MKKRILAMACCLALMLGCLAGLGLTASAVSDGYTAGTVGQYKSLARYADLSVEMAGLGDSLIKGMLPASNTALTSFYSDNNCANATAEKKTSSLLSALTDGQTGTSDALTRTVLATSTATMYFDIGYEADITDFIISTSQSDSFNYSVLYNSAIYVGSSTTNLVSSDNQVWGHTFEKGTLTKDNGYSLRIQPADGATVTGRYVAFVISIPSDPVTNWYGQLRLGEVAVYGTPSENTAFTVKPVLEESDIPTKTALNRGVKSYRWDYKVGVNITGGNRTSTSDTTPANADKLTIPNRYTQYYATGVADVLSDGTVLLDKGEYKTTTSATNASNAENFAIPYEEGTYWEQWNAKGSALTVDAAYAWRGWNSDDANYIFFDLGSSIKVDQLLLGAYRGLPGITSSNLSYCDCAESVDSRHYQAPGVHHNVKELKVYISDDIDSLFGQLTVVNNGDGGTTVGDDANTTLACTVGMATSTVNLVTLDEAVQGRYVGIRMVNSGVQSLSEIAVYGDLGEDVTTVTGNPTFLTDESDAELIPPVESNLLAGRLVDTGANWVTQSNVKRYIESTDAISNMPVQSVATLADGIIYPINSSTTQNTMLNVGNKYTSFVSPGYAATGVAIIDLGMVQTINKVLVGYASDTGVGLRQWFGKVYVGNDVNTLVSDENLIGSWSYVKDGTLPSTITDHGVLFSFEPQEAQYVAIKVPVNALGYASDPGTFARFQEIGIYAPNNSLTTIGGQIRTSGKALPAGSGKAALRLASTLACEGVVVNDYVGDYSKATITWCDVSYPIEEVGTLVAKESDITKNDLTPEEALKYDVTPTAGGLIVPAKKVYSQAADGKSITFTAVITNVPYYMYGTDICARPYVRYTTADGTKTLYGDVMTRNVYDVWADTEDTSREVLDRAEYLQDGSGYFEKNARVVFLGDSITNNGSFIAEIFKYYAAKYPEDKVEMYMAGVKGGNAGGGLTYLEDQVLSLNPDYVSIMFGMNDIYRSLYTNGYQGTAEQVAKIDAYAANMENIVKTLQAKGVKVILCTPTPYDETGELYNSKGVYVTPCTGCAEALRLCGEKAKALATKYGCELVDFNGPMTQAVAYVQDEANGGNINNTIIGSDRVHPGTIGHDLMARIWLSTIGENVTIPTNEYLLACVNGTAAANTTFKDIGTEFAAKVSAVSGTGITGSANMAVCSYWEGEFTFVGTANYKAFTLQQKIDKVATYSGQYTGDWRGLTCIPNFEANAKALGSNRAKVIEAVKKVYATE